MEKSMARLGHLLGLLAESAAGHSGRGVSLSGGTRPGDGPSGLSIWVDSDATRRRVEMYITPVIRDGTPELKIQFFEGTPTEILEARGHARKSGT